MNKTLTNKARDTIRKAATKLDEFEDSVRIFGGDSDARRLASDLRAILAAQQPEPRAEATVSIARGICISLECTAQWLEHGNDPKAAAIELRMQIAKMVRAGDAS
ncbi:hypothetical protein DIE14_01265 [Burkholderia sp. Bp9017]|uniref:hypothetical protein n=1 Tax=unclassified Burkholderia TaxID=2613784 RepID=UPI000F5E3246|nr:MULTISPECIES: hypothetical protein [unclassified Burkholderia]RQZ31573.1 hypothetical protein DIE14_01265 [Burkholderia sp. Bp9017]RQZ37705.1 hypothetical protein DIE13_01255 [Burkholderia sp. Bp9016]